MIRTVTLIGCDDSTQFLVAVTPEQDEFLKELETRSVATSGYHCEPTLARSEETVWECEKCLITIDFKDVQSLEEMDEAIALHFTQCQRS